MQSELQTNSSTALRNIVQALRFVVLERCLKKLRAAEPYFKEHQGEGKGVPTVGKGFHKI